MELAASMHGQRHQRERQKVDTPPAAGPNHRARPLPTATHLDVVVLSIYTQAVGPMDLTDIVTHFEKSPGLVNSRTGRHPRW